MNISGERPLVVAAFAAYLAAFITMAASAVFGRRRFAGRLRLAADAETPSGGNEVDGEEHGAELGADLGPSPQACTGPAIFALGFAAAVAAVIVRWVRAGHVPMQSMYEVFLCLGPAAFLVWLLGRVRRVGGDAWDALLGAAVLFPAAFVMDPWPQQLPPALQSGLFAPHVAAYMIGYMLVAKAGILAIGQLAGWPRRWPPWRSCEHGAYQMVCLAMPPLTLGLILGAVWGKRAWGDWWNWDPKELWSLATWLTFAAYLHFRSMTGGRFKSINSILALAGVAGVIITLLWVNLSRIC
jgi:ABC-type transport system involved in cytochrome c biogenesis permease subunit